MTANGLIPKENFNLYLNYKEFIVLNIKNRPSKIKNFFSNAKNKKSVSGTSEQSYINYHHYPLIPSLKATINNSTNLIDHDEIIDFFNKIIHS